MTAVSGKLFHVIEDWLCNNFEFTGSDNDTVEAEVLFQCYSTDFADCDRVSFLRTLGRVLSRVHAVRKHKMGKKVGKKVVYSGIKSRRNCEKVSVIKVSEGFNYGSNVPKEGDGSFNENDNSSSNNGNEARTYQENGNANPCIDDNHEQRGFIYGNIVSEKGDENENETQTYEIFNVNELQDIDDDNCEQRGFIYGNIVSEKGDENENETQTYEIFNVNEFQDIDDDNCEQKGSPSQRNLNGMEYDQENGDIRRYFSKVDKSFAPVQIVENNFEKKLPYRQKEKEHERFDFSVFSKHWSNVKGLNSNSISSSKLSLEDALQILLPKPLRLDDVRSLSYSNSAKCSSYYERQIKVFLCSSFLPVKSGIAVTSEFRSTYIGDSYPQFSVVPSEKLNLVFKCELCLQYLRKNKREIGGDQDVVLEGFRQTYVHFISKNHRNAIDWWQSNMKPISFKQSIREGEERKITSFIAPIKKTISGFKSTAATPVMCSYIWNEDIVNSFKNDGGIRRKQQKTIFTEKKLWKHCCNKKDHERCYLYDSWKKKHVNELKSLSEESRISSRSVFVPGGNPIVVSGKSITPIGGIKSLDPMCLGKAWKFGDHPYTCDNCYKQLPDLRNFMSKRKQGILYTADNRIGRSGFRIDYAKKDESEEAFKNVYEEKKNMSKTLCSFKKAAFTNRTWNEMISRSCQAEDQEQLLIDLIALFDQPCKRFSLQLEIIKNLVGKMKSGVNHQFSQVITDIALIHRNRLGLVNYSLLQNLIGLPGKTKVASEKKKYQLHLGMNSNVFDVAAETYKSGPVVDCTDEARVLRFVTAYLNKDGVIELIGQCFNPDIEKWHFDKTPVPRATNSDTVDDYTAMKMYIDKLVERNLLAKSCAIHNFSSATGIKSSPLVYLIWPTPNKGYNASYLLKIWDTVRYNCFVDTEGNLKGNPTMLLGHASDSAGFQLSAAASLMTPNKDLMDMGVVYLTLGIGESAYAAPYLSGLPSIAYLDFDHEMRLLFKCLKYNTLDLTIWNGHKISIEFLKDLKRILMETGEPCPFTDGDLLFARYLDQNCDAALKVFTEDVATLLEKHVEGSQGIVLYIKAVHALMIPFISPSSSPNDMQKSISTGITILRMWRRIVQLKKWKLNSVGGAATNPSNRGNFLTHPCYKTAEILFCAATCHMLAMFCHFHHLGPKHCAPNKCGTRTTERLISELQGKTNEIQCLDAQPTLGDIVHRISNVQSNQLAEDSLFEQGASKMASTNRKRMSMNQSGQGPTITSYIYPRTYDEFIKEQRNSYFAGVEQAKELFRFYCPQAVQFLEKENECDISYEVLSEKSQFKGDVTCEYVEDKIFNIRSSEHILVKVNNVVEEEEGDHNVMDEFFELSNQSDCNEKVGDEDQKLNDKNESDGRKKWLVSRICNNKISYVNIAKAIKILLPREYVARERAKRHIASNYLPDKAPLDDEHDVIKFRYIVFSSCLKIIIGKVVYLEQNGKSVISASSKGDAKMRLLVFGEVKENCFIVSSPAKFTKWLNVSNAFGEVQLIYCETEGLYSLSPHSRKDFIEVLDTWRTRKDYAYAKKLSVDDMGSDFVLVEDIVGKRYDMHTHSIHYLVKFANCDESENLWLPLTSFSEVFRYSSREKQIVTDSGGDLYAIKEKENKVKISSKRKLESLKHIDRVESFEKVQKLEASGSTLKIAPKNIHIPSKRKVHDNSKKIIPLGKQTKKSKNNDFKQLIRNQREKRKSTKKSILGNITAATQMYRHGIWLDDLSIMAAVNTLKFQFPRINGLQDVILSQKQFKPVLGPALQIHHLRYHWVTTYFDEEVLVYDSGAQSCVHDKVLKKQISECYKDGNTQKKITVRFPKVQIQTDGSSCGLFAIAFAFEKALGNDPENVCFDQDQLASHITECVQQNCIKPFPRSGKNNSEKLLFPDESIDQSYEI